MERSDIKRLVSLIGNILIVLLVVLYFALALNNIGTGALTSPGWGLLKYYTVLSNLLSGIAAAILIPFEIVSLRKKSDSVPLWALLLKFVSTVALMITFLVTAFFLGPTSVLNGGTYWSMFEGGNIIVHFLVPMLAFITFCFFETEKEIKFPYSFLGLSTLLLYGIFYVINYYLHLIPGDGVEGQSQYDWYGFFQNDNVFVVILVVILMIGFAYLVSFLLWFLRKKMGKKDIREA